METLASTWKLGRRFSVGPGQGARETSLASEVDKGKDKKGQEAGNPEGQRDGVGLMLDPKARNLEVSGIQ